jgi:tetratricopeptide (TPR) repeat protein
VIGGLGRLAALVRRRPRLACGAVLALALLALAGLWAGGYFGAGRSYRLAEEAIERGDFPEALGHLNACLESWPDSAATHFLAARTARRAGLFEQARRHLARCQALQGSPSIEVRLEQDLLRAQQGEAAALEAHLKGLIDQGHPDRFLILEACVAGYLKNHQLKRALLCLDWWLERRPEEVRALRWRGWAWQRLRCYDDAARDYRRAVELAPGRAEARLDLARFLLERSRADEAAGHFQRVLDSQPDNAEARLGLARCRRRQGRLGEAGALLDAVLASRPDEPTALAERGLVALAAGEPEAAAPYLRRAAERLPDDRELVYNLGLCLGRLGDADGARAWRDRLEALDKDLRRIDWLMRRLPTARVKAPLRYEGAVLLLRYGKREEALGWLLTALEDDPEYRPAHEALAAYYEAAGRTDLAARHRRLAGQGNATASTPGPAP